MKDLNNVKIIAVDHGYGNIKTANTIFPAGITEYESEPIFSGNILEYGGKFYRIGEEHKEFISDKAITKIKIIKEFMNARRMKAYETR